MKQIITALLVAFALAACSPGVRAEEHSYIPHPSSAAAPQSDDVQTAILEQVWGEQPYVNRAGICDGWQANPDLMLDAFLSKVGDIFDRDVARDFFEEKCA